MPNMNKYKERFQSLKGELSGFFRRQGFSIMLFLCLAVVSIASAVAFFPQAEPAPTPTPAPIAEDASASSAQRLSAAVNPTAAPSATPTATPAVTPAPTEKPQDNRAASPVSGPVIFGYAVDSLLYSPTLECWTTHPGVDLAATAGEEVRVIQGGTVLEVSKEHALGVTVRVSHEGGLVSLYANLQENPPVSAGDKISTGDVLGFVGDTAISECAMEPHLHLAIYQNDLPLDPAQRVLFVKENNG